MIKIGALIKVYGTVDVGQRDIIIGDYYINFLRTDIFDKHK